ncbi:MAG TPA: LytTR family DNA-binding domain-containing protein [Flavipsychrobacter sp.]|nr:LytTR family DNA-binding domain-containing protein [Flavipsychrobacter sp.]
MITSIAIDDEPLALNVIQAFCKKIEGVKLLNSFTETTAALNFLKENPVQLIFLDINMPAISGIEFIKLVPKDTMVIFTTAYSEYAVEGFNLNAIDFLLKPFDFNRFSSAIDKAIDFYRFKLQSAQTQHLFIKVDYSVMKIEMADIEYIEGLDNYLKIHLVDKKSVMARMSMKSLMEKLPEKDFIRVHRSYIIPFAKVKAVRNKTIYLKNIEIPVGANYVDQVSQLFKNT